MARKFVTALDLLANELQNAVIQLLASDPGSPVNGQVWVNSTSWVLKIRLNGVTIQLGRLDQISAPTADVAMGTHKITGLGDPGAAQDATTRSYVLARSLSEFAAPTGDLAIGTNKLTGVKDPTLAQDAATKNYVDNTVNGLDWKSPVRVASTANVPLTTGLVNGQAIDGVTLATGDRVLLKNQAAGAENGIYVAVAAGTGARSADADSAAEILQLAVGVEEGTAGADTFWVNTTNAPITLNTTALVFAQFGAGATYTAGAGLQLVGNVFSIEGGSNILLPLHGGTGAASLTAHTVPVAEGASAMVAVGPGTQYQGLHSGGAAADPLFDAVHLDQAAAITGNLPVGNGGTGAATAAAARSNLGAVGKYAVSVGDGAATSITVNHALNTTDVVVQVHRVASPFDVVEPDIQVTDANNVTLLFASAPSASQFRAVVTG